MNCLSRSLLLVPLFFLACSAGGPVSTPIINPGVAPVTTNIPSLTASATRFDLAADGVDSVAITAVAKQANGSPLFGAQILWTVSGRNFSGSVGTVTSVLTITDSNGVASTGYRSPSLEFVPVGASVTVRGSLQLPGNPEGSPTASTTFILRPKGVSPGTDSSGQLVRPTITAVTPSTIQGDKNPPVTVIVQGSGFSESSQILLITDEELFTITPTFFSSEQLRFDPPLLTRGDATVFVTGAGDTLSDGFAITIETGTTIADDAFREPIITAIVPTQIVVGQSARMVLIGERFNVESCPAAGAVIFINEVIGLVKVCPVTGEPSTSESIVVDSPVFGSTQAGTVSVFVRNDDGLATPPVTVTVLPDSTNSPVISSLAPSTGPTTGNTKVIISGTNFDSSHSVIITGPQIFSTPGDSCADGNPVCSNNQCVLSAARGLCTINGQANVDVFNFIGPGTLEIVTPSVGSSAAGTASVLVVTPEGRQSNISSFVFTAPRDQLPPTIVSIDPVGYAGAGCCDSSWTLIIRGTNFRRCSSVVISHLGSIHEILPTPDLSDCDVKRGSEATLSPRERLQTVLPPDGMTISCTSRPDLVPFRSFAGGTYRHDQICVGAGTTAYSPLIGTIIGAVPNDITNGGAVQWINESQIRILFGPPHRLPCATSDSASIYVSNDPGRGLAGDLVSDAVAMSFNNTAECDDAGGVAVSPAQGNCQPGLDTIVITGGSFTGGTTTNTTVEFGSGNFGTVLAVSFDTILVLSPPSPGGCVFVCPDGATVCPTVQKECSVTVVVTNTSTGSLYIPTGGFTYLETGPNCPP